MSPEQQLLSPSPESIARLARALIPYQPADAGPALHALADLLDPPASTWVAPFTDSWERMYLRPSRRAGAMPRNARILSTETKRHGNGSTYQVVRYRLRKPRGMRRHIRREKAARG